MSVAVKVSEIFREMATYCSAAEGNIAMGGTQGGSLFTFPLHLTDCFGKRPGSNKYTSNFSSAQILSLMILESNSNSRELELGFQLQELALG